MASKTKSESDVTMTWCQYWAWFQGDIITDRERKETFSYFLKARPLSGMTRDAVLDVLEFAPKHVVKFLFDQKIIDQETLDGLNALGAGPDAPPDKKITRPSWEQMITLVRGESK